MKTLAAAALLLLTFAVHAAPKATSAALRTLLAGFEREGYSGSVLVAKDGRVLLQKGYGLANRALGIRNAADTRFEIASISKTFTAAAILKLESEGKLSTSDLISLYLGKFPTEKSAATIHHLATHTAGLVHKSAGNDLAYGTDRERFIESVKSAPIESAPGASYRYSNVGYVLLAAIVEKVSGETFEDYIRRNFIVPLKLTHTGFSGDAPREGEPPLAIGYIGDAIEPVDPFDWDERGAGGMVSTVGDVHRWVVALRDGRVLTPAATKKMFRRAGEESYAWHITQDERGKPFIHKGGGMPTFASQILIYPQDGVMIVWTQNDLKQPWRQKLNQGLAAVVTGK